MANADGLQNVHYERIRSYEMATVQEAVGKEMLLTIVEGEKETAQSGDGEPSQKKRKGAYITPIGSKILLRKTRAKVSHPLLSPALVQ